MEKLAPTCGIHRALEVIGSKWTLLVVYALLEKECRFRELEQQLDISPRTLTTRLKALESQGILERDCPEHAHPRYRLTAKGRSLSKLLEHMNAWGASSN